VGKIECKLFDIGGEKRRIVELFSPSLPHSSSFVLFRDTVYFRGHGQETKKDDT